jgi:hypothetical protein
MGEGRRSESMTDATKTEAPTRNSQDGPAARASIWICSRTYMSIDMRRGQAERSPLPVSGIILTLAFQAHCSVQWNDR